MRSLWILCVLPLSLDAAADARAAVVALAPSGVATVAAAPGERNDLVVDSRPDGGFVIRDAAASLAAGPGCDAEVGAVACPASTPLQRMRVTLGDGDDRANITDSTAFWVRVEGGPGADQLVGASDQRGGPGDDRLADGSLLRGGPGGDLLTAAVGGSSLFGGPGRDRAVGGPGDDSLYDAEPGREAVDVFDGGNGTDHVHYRQARQPVRIDLAAGTATGGPVQDALNSIEAASGGHAGDLLLGTPESDLLIGGNGADRLRGLGGDDIVVGRSGDDRLRGGRGDDSLGGYEYGDDRLDGGPGADELRGEDGADTLRLGRGDEGEPGAGADRVRVLGPGAAAQAAADWSRDHLHCRVALAEGHADRGDRVGARCGKVRRWAVEPLLFPFERGPVPVDRAGTFALRAICP
ncbi:MAG TPA: calcium-binding protein, partial [Capillimicrobium sp.]